MLPHLNFYSWGVLFKGAVFQKQLACSEAVTNAFTSVVYRALHAPGVLVPNTCRANHARSSHLW